MSSNTTPRIVIEDLPAEQPLTEAEMAALLGAGRFRPTLEQLESRELMASGLTASLSGGLLQIQDTQAGDTIHVRQMGGQVSVDGMAIQVGGASQGSVSAASVARIELHTPAGNDQVWLGDVGATLTMPVSLQEGAAGDSLFTPTRSSGLTLGSDVQKVVDGNDAIVYVLHSDGGLYGFTANSNSGVLVGTGVSSLAVASDGSTLILQTGTLKQHPNGADWLTGWSVVGTGVSSFAVASDGSTLILQAGTLKQHPNGASWLTGWSVVGTGVSSLAVASDGSTLILQAGTLKQHPNGADWLTGWSVVGTGVSSFAVASDGSTLILQASTLKQHPNGADWLTGWSVVGTGVSSFAVASDGSTLILQTGTLKQHPNGADWLTGWSVVGTGVSSLAVASDGSTLILQTGTLKQHSNGADWLTGWSAVGTGVSSFAVASDGSTLILQASTLKQHPNGADWLTGWSVVGTGVSSFAMASDGSTLILQTGTLKQHPNGADWLTGWSVVGTGVSSLAVASDGSTLILQTGTLKQHSNGADWLTGWSVVGTGVSSFAVASDGSTLILQTGTLKQHPNGADWLTGWSVVGTGVSSFAMASDGSTLILQTGTLKQHPNGADWLTGWSVVGTGAVTAADGSVWFLGTTNADGLGNHAIYRLNNGQLNTIPGFGNGVGVAEGSVWLVNTGNQVWLWGGSNWSLENSLTVAVGSVWFLGTTNADGLGNHAIYRFSNGQLTPMTGYYGVNLGVAEGTVWALNAGNAVYYWNAGSNSFLPQASVSLVIGGCLTNTVNIWFLGNTNADGLSNHAIYCFSGGQLTKIVGYASDLAAGYGTVWIVNEGRQGYRWNGSYWDQVAQTLQGPGVDGSSTDYVLLADGRLITASGILLDSGVKAIVNAVNPQGQPVVLVLLSDNSIYSVVTTGWSYVGTYGVASPTGVALLDTDDDPEDDGSSSSGGDGSTSSGTNVSTPSGAATAIPFGDPSSDDFSGAQQPTGNQNTTQNSTEGNQAAPDTWGDGKFVAAGSGFQIFGESFSGDPNGSAFQFSADNATNPHPNFTAGFTFSNGFGGTGFGAGFTLRK